MCCAGLTPPKSTLVITATEQTFLYYFKFLTYMVITGQVVVNNKETILQWMHSFYMNTNAMIQNSINTVLSTFNLTL